MPGKRNKHCVIGIYGSPRHRGNTARLLDEALAGAASRGAYIQKVFLNDLRFRGCQGCYACLKTGVCALSDDMGRIYNMLGRADVIMLASPVFFGSVTAQLKAMIDRFNCFWMARRISKRRPFLLRRKSGYFICVSDEHRRKYFSDSAKVVRNLFATLGIKYSGGLFFGNVGHLGAVDIGNPALRKAFLLGKRSV